MNQTEKFLSDTRLMTLEWYKQADAKAQIILGFTGVFLSLVVGMSLSSGSDSILVEYVKESPGYAIEALLLILPIPFYCASVVLSAWALWSRGVFEDKKKGIHFFGSLANYVSTDALSEGHEKELREAIDVLKKDIARHLDGCEASIDQLAQDLLILSRNTRLKHRLVNFAATFAGAALIGTLASFLTIAFSVLKVGY
jgi:hypothetical protein